MSPTAAAQPSTIALEPSDGESRRLRGGWLVAARVSWMALLALSLAVVVVALPAFYQAARRMAAVGAEVPGQLAPADVQLLLRWHVTLDAYAAYQTLQVGVFALVYIGVGTFLAWRKPDDGVAWFVSLWFLMLGPTGSPLLDPLIRSNPSWQLPVRFLQGAGIGCFPIFTYLFPDGRFVPPWTRQLTMAWVLWLLVSPFTSLAVADFEGPSRLWFGILVPGGMAIGLLAQAHRYRRISNRGERGQAQWVLCGLALLAAGFALYGLLPLALPAIEQAGLVRVLYLNLAETFLLVLPLCLLPLFIVVAVLRHGLYGIDLILNRGLIYGTLSAGIVALYALLVGLFGAWFQSRGNLLGALLATGAAAVLFQPLRMRLQRGVNHLMYGHRDDPYTVLSHLSQQLRTTLEPGAVLPNITETVARTLKLPYVALALEQAGRLHIAAVHGSPVDQPLRLNLVHQAETIGQLLVAPRAPGEAFTPAERRLLEDVALQAGAAAHAVRLAADLQGSRERLVTAREDERRRLRRDLHDGLGPQLASLTLTIGAARELLRQDADAADLLLGELSGHVQAAIADIRRLVYDLRPPALDDFGLVPVLREQAARISQAGLQITVVAPEQPPDLPAAVEVAAFRIAQEAMTNVLRHARARACALTLTFGEDLVLEVRDDGVGLPAGLRAGVGLASIRERTAELGGLYEAESAPGRGTRIRVSLPLRRERP